MADIDLTDFLEDESPSQGWQPVGTSSAPFKGVLDGNGKTVSGLWIKRANTDYVGFFGNTDGATIKNLKIVATKIVGKDNVGGISGYSKNSTINGCSFIGEIQGGTYVGGYIGSSGSNMTLFENLAEVTVTGTGDNVGGLIGKGVGGVSVSNCKIINAKIHGGNYVGGICGTSTNGDNNYSFCYVYSSISGVDYVGGICGQTKYYRNNLTDCGFNGDIYANSMVGGIVGEYSQGSSYSKYASPNPTLTNCYCVGNIITSGDNVGGIVGITNADSDRTGPLHGEYTVYHINEIAFSYFYGNVKGSQNVGGIVGFKQGGGVISCYSRGNVSGDMYIGGICGQMVSFGFSELKTNIANVISIKANQGVLGRVYGSCGSGVGKIGTPDENKAYNLAILIDKGVVQEVEDSEQNGSSVSTTTLKLKATYVAMGWDFTNTWAIQEMECYPYFKTQTAPPIIQSQVVSGATTISGKCVDDGTVTLEIDGMKQQMVSTGHDFSFTVSPLQAGHEVRVSAKADGKEQSYYTTEVVSFLGKGTEADPYQISTAADLTQVYRNGYYKLMNDIDLTDYINQFSPTEGWESIGREGSETIHFDGDGHKITGLWCNSTRDNTGLFSCFANGTIKNLTVEVTSGKQLKGGNNTGILIGKMMNGTIENCHVSGSVADGTPVGGIVGLFDGGTISHCQADVTICSTLTTSYVGGLVGEITGGTIDQCVTTGTLKATGTESYVGGLVGKNSATVTNCYSTATITSSYNAAGLVAYNYGVVDMCYAIGNLYSNNYAAGVIGYNDGANAVVSNCAAMNNKIDVTFESQSAQSGGYGQRIIGGIKNGAPAPEMNNYALKTMQVSLNDVPQKVYDDIMNGTAKTNDELKQKATYQELDWDFDNVWKIDEGASYPYQTVKVDGGSDPTNPDDPDPDDPQGEIEVTDISTMNNVIYFEPIEEMSGTQATISLKMKNAVAIRGFQFDLYLPEGVTVVKSSKGKIQGFLSAGRLPEEDEHSLTFSEQADGAIRFLCSSQYDETFTGNDGEIATLRVNIAEDMADGDYLVKLKNIKLTETDISKYYQTELVKCKLTIKSYTIGDINSDGVVDVSDYTGVANYIHGSTPEGFVVKAADVDESGTIDVSDYTGIANIIHTGSIYGNSSSQAKTSRPRKTNTDISNNDNVIYIEPFVVELGESTAISIKMKNTAEIRGFQFDLYLPEGVTVVKSAKGRIQGALTPSRLPEDDEHDLTFSEQSDGAIRFLCSSQYDETFTGNDGEIATLRVTIAENMADGNYPVILKNVKLTETDIAKFYVTEEVETTMTVLSDPPVDDPPTDVFEIDMISGNGVYYDLQGRRIKTPSKGLYIVNGKKVIVR